METESLDWLLDHRGTAKVRGRHLSGSYCTTRLAWRQPGRVFHFTTIEAEVNPS